jgi:hypothetical protein
MTRKRDYTVGYCQPPLETRFQKGKCPNPNGRPRKGTSRKEIRERVLSETIAITRNGRKVFVTVYEAMLLQLRGMALGRDLRAMALLMKVELANENMPGGPDRGEELDPIPDDDRGVIDRYLARKGLGGAKADNEDQVDE